MHSVRSHLNRLISWLQYLLLDITFPLLLLEVEVELEVEAVRFDYLKKKSMKQKEAFVNLEYFSVEYFGRSETNEKLHYFD